MDVYAVPSVRVAFAQNCYGPVNHDPHGVVAMATHRCAKIVANLVGHGRHLNNFLHRRAKVDVGVHPSVETHLREGEGRGKGWVLRKRRF